MTAEDIRGYVDVATGWALLASPAELIRMGWEEYEEYRVWQVRALNRLADLYPSAYREVFGRPADEVVAGGFADEVPF